MKLLISQSKMKYLFGYRLIKNVLSLCSCVGKQLSPVSLRFIHLVFALITFIELWTGAKNCILKLSW